jgi:hypothetical protein
MPHPTGDAALGYLIAEHDQLAVNTRSAPCGILCHHLEDKLANLLGHRFSADAHTPTRDEPPIQLKAGSVPTNNGIGRYDNQRFSPRRPETTKDNPKQLVDCRKPGTAAPSLEHCQLLTQSEVFNQYSLARSKQAKGDTEPEAQKVEHGSNS